MTAQYTILITGGTGMIGSALSHRLLDAGHRVHILTRSPRLSEQANYQEYKWDIHNSQIDPAALEGVTHVFNMVGANVNGKRWNKSYKEEIKNSRVQATRFLIEKIQQNLHSLPKFISFSGTGIYGDCGQKPVDEYTEIPRSNTTDFLAEVCIEWEREALRIPSTILRIPPVLSKNGGALPTLIKQNSRGVIAMVGSPKNYFPWIHIDDLMNLCMYCITSETPQYINATAPLPVTNRTLMRSLKKHFKLFGPIITMPSWVIHLIIGEVSTELCKSIAAHSSVLKKMAWKFKFPDIDAALKDLCD